MKKLFLLLSLPAILSADIFHYQKLYQGDSATFLGGAYTALSQDNAGMYNNPAGFIYSQNVASMSIQAYNYSTFNYLNANTETGKDYSKVSQGVFPTMVTYSLSDKYLGGKVGFFFLTEDQMNVNQHDNSHNPNFGDDHTELSMQQSYSVLNGGATFSKKISNSLSFGITLAGTIRSNQYINKQFVDWTLGDNKYNFTDSLYAEDKQYGFKPTLGLLYKKGFNSFGISVSQEFIIHRNYKFTYSKFEIDDETSTLQSKYQTIISDETPDIPLNINLGYAFENQSQIFSVDLKYYSAVNKVTYGKSEEIVNNFVEDKLKKSTETKNIETFDIVSQEVINLSFGYSYKFDKLHKVNLGFFTDFSKVSDNTIISDKYLDGEAVDMMGGTLSYGFPISNDKKFITVGLLYSSGTGIANYGNLALFSDNIDSLDVKQEQIMFFLNMQTF